ncbi:ATP-binding protein, partial [Pyxidicoccus sp. 3LG]
LRGRRLKEVSADAGWAAGWTCCARWWRRGRPTADSFSQGEAFLQGTAVPLRDGVMLRLRDVTSAVRVEEGVRDTLAWVRDVLEGTPDAFFTMDADWRVTYINIQAAAISGRPQEQLFRRVLWEACPELVGTRFERELRRVASEGVATTFEVRTSPGRWHEVHAWCSNGNLTVFGTDISDKKRVEAERDMLLAREHSGRLEAEALVRERTSALVDARERLVQSEKLAIAGQLAAGVGHEINNPLSYVTGNLQFALEQLELAIRQPGDNTEALREALEALQEAREGAERIRVTVRDLQTFARADEPHLSPVDVHAALEFGLSMAMPHLRYRAQVERRYGGVPTVMGHEARLGQVFLQLLVNAAHAIPEGDAAHHRVTLTTRSEGTWVVVEVTDTGHGMPPEVAERVFEPFFTTRPLGTGTGMGLSTALGLVRSMRGELTVTSTPGGGSTFRVRLPTTTDEAAQPPGPESAEEGAGSRRVLVVDDEPQLASVLRRILGGRHDVVLVHSGREALELLEKDDAFDLVFCDLMMGDLTGMDVHAELARHNPELLQRFVFMTGGGFTERARSFLQTVPLPRIEKPFEPSTLRALVEGAPPRAGASRLPARAAEGK